jgi:hypothetical protein
VDPRTIGWIGGIGGAALGVLGGAIGTYFGIKNTAGPRERAFMIKAAVLAWIAAFLVALWWTPLSYQAWLWVSYVLALLLAVCASNRRQARIRREESSGVGSD